MLTKEIAELKRRKGNDHMKNVLACVVAVAMLIAVGSAFADVNAKAYHWSDNGKQWDDLSWWGTSGATPEPFKDATRTGYWWWPTNPASNVDDSELWGNRGKIFHNLIVAEETVAPPAEPPVVERVKPVVNNVLFDFDKAVLKPEGKAETDKVIADMKEFPGDTVVLEGHTDSIGSDAYNMGLGQRRADAVQKYMVEQGIAPERITTKSFGESSPAVPNDTPANRKLNRRVVFDISIAE